MSLNWTNPNDLCIVLLSVLNVVLLVSGIVVFCWALSGYLHDRLYSAAAAEEEPPVPGPPARSLATNAPAASGGSAH